MMINKLLRQFLFLLLCFSFTSSLAFAATTLTFTSDGGGAWADGIAEDGEGGSTNIAGITIQILNITNTSGANLGSMSWKDNNFLASGDPAYSALTYGQNAGSKGMAIKSSDGSEFQINSFKYYNWGETASFTNTVKGYKDGSEVASMTFDGYDSTNNYIPMTVSFDSTFDNVDEVRIYISAGGYLGNQSATNDSINDIVIDSAPFPTISSASYNASTGALVVTGTNFTATVGATNDVIANKFTFTGEGSSTYLLTDTANVEITSATSFTLTLSATDRAAVNLIVNKSGTSSTGATTYNLAGAAGFIADSGATADLTGNGITATVAAPTVTSATYDASTGTLVVTGTNLKKLNGATNDIVANKFTLSGEGGSTYTLTDTGNVEVTSGTSFTLTLSATDKAGANLILNKNGTLSTDISTYTLAAAEDWNAGASAAVTIADTAGNIVTVSNVAVPTIMSATYNASSGALVVTGAGFLKRAGATNDIVANKFTFTGQGGSTYTLTDTANVEITSGTSFTLTLSATDQSAIGSLLNKNGTSSTDATTYNVAAAEDWAAGADSAVVVADLTGNGITTNNALSAPDAPTIGAATAGDGQVSVAFTAPVSNGGSAITGYTVTSNPGNISAGGNGFTTSPITVTGLTNGTAYTFTVTATNAIGTSTASSASGSATPKSNQTITFVQPATQNFGTTPTLSATATSSLIVSFSSSTTSVCTITSGGALTFVTAGSCTIDADQAGNASNNAAPTVSRTFTVSPVAPGAPTIGTATAGDTQATVTFTAPASTGGAAIIAGGYTVTANPGGVTATGSSSPITVTGLTNGVSYTFTVTATNSAGEGAASAASNSVTPASPQAITFNNPGSQNFGTTPTLTATSSAGGGYPVSFSSSTTGVCTITAGGALTFVTAGSCTINANQAGDSSYLAASQVSQTFTVAAVVPGAPTAATATAGDTQASIAFTAPAFIGGATITGYTVTVNPADVAPVSGASSPIVVTGLTNGQAYTFTVTATNAVGTGSASAASNSVAPKATQTITFAAPGAQNFGTTPTFTATADSGLTPIFTSSTTGVCTITTGGALTFVTAGTCTINANQAGNSSYLPAPQVTRSFVVNAVVPGAPTAATANAGDAQATVSFAAPAFTGGAAVTSFTVTASPGGATATGAVSPINVSGLANGTAYTFTVRATNLAGTGAASAASSAVVPQASQTIDFSNPGAQNLDSVLTVTATASSGLTPTFSSFTASVCTVSSGGAVTFLTTGTCTISANQVGDAIYSAATPVTRSFAVEPKPNYAPSISGSPGTSTAQGIAYSFTPTAADQNSDPLTFSIINKPSWASFNTATGVLSGTPVNEHVGVTNGVVISVSDGTLSTSLPPFSITVVNVNDAPVIGGSPTIKVNQDIVYSFVPTSTDPDGDKLTFSVVNRPAWASFDIVTGRLTGTPTKADVGTTTGIVISVSDGTASAVLPTFNIEVVSTVDPLQPIVTAPAGLDLNAMALFTPVDIRQLLGISANASAADVELALKGLASDGVSGKNCCTASAEGLSATNKLLLAPGRHEVKWKATNSAGVTGEAIQIINVQPLVSFNKSQLAVRGSQVELRVLLNGAAPKYPFSVPYEIDAASTAGLTEHNLRSGLASFTQEGQLEVVIPIAIAALTGLSDSQLSVNLGSGINAGATKRHVIDIRQGNVPPVVGLVIRQGGIETSLITPSGGPVTVSANVSDANKQDTHTFDWSATMGLADTDGNPIDASRTFDPTGLSGSRQLQVSVTDSAGTVVQAQTYLRVVSSLPVLSQTTDTDKDGFSDALEGTGDVDSNGIPDYLDNMPSPNILPQQGNTTNAFLIECDPGVRCGLGLFARSGSSGGVQILDQELGSLSGAIVDPAFEPVGGIFDFAIRDLPIAGQSVRVVIPQRAAIPSNAVYRKFQKGKWVSFISDTENAIHSAPGNLGYCPPPGASDWQLGLSAGHLCVQLTIKDGGANDDDGLVNSAVVDPGAVSVELPDPPDIEVKAKRGGAMGEVWLLLLAGLLLLNRFNSTRLVIALLALVAVNTQANTEGDIYARVDIYQAKGDQTRGDFNSALINAGHTFILSGYDVSRMAYQVAVGYGWNDFTYTEIGYLDLGETKVDLLLNGNEDLAGFGASLAKHYPRTASGITLSQAFIYALDSHWRLVGDIGLFVWQDETNLNITGITLNGDDGVDPIWGVGVDYKITDALRFGANIREVAFGDQKVSLLGASARWAF